MDIAQNEPRERARVQKRENLLIFAIRIEKENKKGKKKTKREHDTLKKNH